MKWTREHEIVVLDLYCRIPFQKANNSNKNIQDLAELLGRSTNSVKMKIGNFGSFDPELKRLGIAGLDGTSHLDKDVWNYYYGRWNLLAYDAKQILANYHQNKIEIEVGIDSITFPPGEERECTLKQRINQTFFRSAVLSSYSNRCCITGINDTRLLEAAHILSWADNEENRTNPSNGLCMNALMHSAYDEFMFSLSQDYIIYVSEELLTDESNNSRQIDFFRKVHRKSIILPNRFLPNRDFLKQHFEKYKSIH